MKQKITIHVRLDPARFRRFCRFDNFRRQHRWFVPVMTGMIMITISMALLFFGKARSETLPGILMGLGIAFPLFCFGIYNIQIESQIAKQNLRSVPEIYTLVLDQDGISAAGSQGDRTRVELTWAQMWAAFRYKGDIYLYISASRAFILPSGQADVPDEKLWELLLGSMDSSKCFNVR